MAASLAKDKSQSQSSSRTSRALAHIGFNSILMDSEVGTTSDDEPNSSQNIQSGDAHSLIGFSIGYEQTRLASPKTPAAEKAAALESADGFFDNAGAVADSVYTEEPGDIGDGEQDRLGGRKLAEESRRQSRQLARFGELGEQVTSGHRLPSPWRATPRTFERSESAKPVMDGVSEEKRKRASSGPLESATEAIRKYLPTLSSLPSLPSFPPLARSPSFLSFSIPSIPNPLSSGHDREVEQPARRPSSASRRHSSPLRNSLHENSPAAYKRSATTGARQQEQHSSNDSGRPSSQHIRISEPDRQLAQRPKPGEQGLSSQGRNAALLRRTTSDESLLLQRSISRVSSLGDDSRFENVSEQVNSRFQAIKDSWQDSNLRLPNLSMRSFGFGSPRADAQSPPPNGRAVQNVKPRSYRPKSLSFTAPHSPQRSFLTSPGTSDNPTPEPPKSGGLNTTSAATHPYFAQALEELEGDLVIMGGYRGSVLRSAEPPNRQLWVPIKVGLNLRKVDLQVGLEPGDEEDMEEHIIPDGMLSHIGPVDISRRLLKRLRASENARKGKLRIWDYGYDWRLSPHILSRKLIEFLGKLPSNQAGVPKEKRGALVIAHSLGGLITRHAINQRPELFSGVVYAGVPTTCINILGPLRNGDDVLFSSRVLTAQVNFTIRTSYALLPLDGRCFVDKDTKEELPVDFFDVNTWVDNCLTPVLAPALPPLSPTSNGPIDGLLGSMSSALASVPLPLRRGSGSRRQSPRNTISGPSSSSTVATTSDSTTVHHHVSNHDHQSPSDRTANTAAQNSGMTPKLNQPQPHLHPPHLNPMDPSFSSPPLSPTSASSTSSTTATTVTLPRPAALAYLARTLAETKLFKTQLAYHAPHGFANAYPPTAVIFGKTTPTVSRARVRGGRDGIRRIDAYDDLAFGSGDGVVLARAAMLPEGYHVVRGGCVSSERGHVTLLGDLEAVGRCLVRVMGARRRGVGFGIKEGEEASGIENGPLRVG
ncbi:MAG: hypothetical protein M1821_010031 [Bathelium mastoideum]|nr:MAG: hypothetical protein M1821_010031 [Bathelium mastoideum]